MATPAQRTNTWTLDEWYDQSVAGTTGGYNGEKQLWVWGGENEGALGLNQPNVNISSPTQLPAGSGNWKSLVHGFTNGYGGSINNTNGNQTMFAIKTDGTLWGWGKNEIGEIPISTNDSYSSPRQIPGTWSKAYQAQGGGAGFKTDGSLWFWGQNPSGQLGQEDTTNRSSPIQIPGAWSSLRTGGDGSVLAFKTDGTLWGWGSGGFGNLAQNNQTQYSSPRQIPGTTWSHFGNNGGFGASSRVFKTDGTLWGWGSTSYGALGQNTGPGGGTERFSSPVQISGTTWSTTGGGEVFIGRKSDGTLWGMGRNTNGQLGLNSRTLYSSPVQIGTNTDWSENIFSNDVCSGGVKTDGSLWFWGFYDNGQFGLNSRDSIGPGTTDGDSGISSPVQLSGSWTGVVGESIAIGYRTSYFMKNV
jgi:alpha-tubulin suppressor-like RCC1 family protein